MIPKTLLSRLANKFCCILVACLNGLLLSWFSNCYYCRYYLWYCCDLQSDPNELNEKVNFSCLSWKWLHNQEQSGGGMDTELKTNGAGLSSDIRGYVFDHGCWPRPPSPNMFGVPTSRCWSLSDGPFFILFTLKGLTWIKGFTVCWRYVYIHTCHSQPKVFWDRSLLVGEDRMDMLADPQHPLYWCWVVLLATTVILGIIIGLLPLIRGRRPPRPPPGQPGSPGQMTITPRSYRRGWRI